MSGRQHPTTRARVAPGPSAPRRPRHRLPPHPSRPRPAPRRRRRSASRMPSAGTAPATCPLTLPNLRSPTPAITAEDVVVADRARRALTGCSTGSTSTSASPPGPRPPARPSSSASRPRAAVAAYLDGVAHDQVVGITDPVPAARAPPCCGRPRATRPCAPPTRQTFWTASATGAGQQELTWRVTGGQWAVVIMNADGSAGVDVAATIGVRAGFLLPLALAHARHRSRAHRHRRRAHHPRRERRAGRQAPPAAAGTPAACHTPAAAASPSRDRWPRRRHRRGPAHPRAVSPVALDARLDEPLSRWLWLVKWFLAIPHFIVLGVPVDRVLAWSASSRSSRSSSPGATRAASSSSTSACCAGRGGCPTTAATVASAPTATRRSASGAEPDYPARLDIAYPARLSRGLVLVKWWLLAIPHYIIVGLLVGGGNWAWDRARTRRDSHLDVVRLEASSACSSSSPGSRSSSPAATRGRSSTSSSASTAGSTASSRTSP